jgi:gliding motility-associated-like protein
VLVTDSLQSGYSYVSSTTTAGMYNPSTGVWTIGSLNNSTSQTLTITAMLIAKGNYINTAIINSNDVDTNTGNNTSTIETQPTDFNIPEGFSPNSDGINDLFVVRGINNYPANTFSIYNRWGNEVFSANNYQNTWDGKSTKGVKVGGDELPIGTYFYVLDLGDGSDIFKGTIYLNK